MTPLVRKVSFVYETGYEIILPEVPVLEPRLRFFQVRLGPRHLQPQGVVRRRQSVQLSLLIRRKAKMSLKSNFHIYLASAFSIKHYVTLLWSIGCVIFASGPTTQDSPYSLTE